MVYRIRFSLSMLALTVLAGCAQTSYVRTDLDMPATWQQVTPRAAQSQQAALAQIQGDHWWEAFGDAQLNQLQALALERNPDLTMAGWKVRNAWLTAGNAASNILPTLSAGVNASSKRALEGDASSTKSFGTSFGASWQLDLWGNLAAQRRQADWEAQATEQDRLATAMSLTGTVATTYWQLALADAKISSQRESLERASKTLQLAQVQYRAGAISGLDLAQAQQAVNQQQANLDVLEQSRVELRHALAILFDVSPQSLPEAAQHPRLPDMVVLPEVPVGVPADVLARRPDVRAAEMRLQASLAHVDAIRTSYYPTLSLTGALGTSSNTLTDLLKNPIGTLGAGLTLPFLNWGTMQRDTRISENSYEQAVVGFRKTLYTALQDVENALSNRRQLALQYTQLQQAAQQAARVEELTGVRYRAGAVALKDWLTVQESQRSANLAVLDARYKRLSNLVTLYQSLGGTPVVEKVKQEQGAL